MTPQELERQLRGDRYDQSLANRMVRTADQMRMRHGPNGQYRVRPAGGDSPPAYVAADQVGYTDSDDPTRLIVPATDNIELYSRGNTGQEKQGFCRLTRPVTSVQGIAVAMSSLLVATEASVTLENITAKVRGIKNSDLDLSTINWSNQTSLTYTANWFSFFSFSLSSLSAGIGSFSLISSGAQNEICCWCPLTRNSGGLTGIGMPGYPDPVYGLNFRIGTLATSDLIYQFVGGGGPNVDRKVRLVEVGALL